MTYIYRQEYLDFLVRHQNKKIIKVVSGVRRAGKSTLFKIFQNHLKASGVSDEQIIDLNFEDLANLPLCDYSKLNQYILEKIEAGQQYYIFLDEIQQVEQFELVVDSLLLKDNLDLYLTGSNAYFLSGELATMLSGRYVELSILPLSFKEVVTWQKDQGTFQNLADSYQKYLRTSFPYAVQLEDDQEINDYLRGIYSTIFLKDIIARLKVSDVDVLERILQFIIQSVGNIISIRKISGFLTSTGLKTSPLTVEKYLRGMADSFLVYEAKRYNIKGKEKLANKQKYYVVDNGFRNLLLPDNEEDYGHILENVVYLELIRRGYDVFVGELGTLEVDFVAIKARGVKIYVQVALTTLDPATLQRELAPLKKISDNYPKYLLTLDQFQPSANFAGIKKMNLLAWLMGEE